jgi:hypothetical protein
MHYEGAHGAQDRSPPRSHVPEIRRRQQKDLHRQFFGKTLERSDGKDEARSVSRRPTCELESSLLLEIGDHAACESGGTAERRRDVRAERLSQVGQDIVADPVPEEPRVAIRGVLDPFEAAR